MFTKRPLSPKQVVLFRVCAFTLDNQSVRKTMTAAASVQALLRFLSHDAKVPLTTCLPKVNSLLKADLGSASNISKSDLKTISSIFTDEKVAKQVFNAAKRVTNPKKRAANDAGGSTVSKLKKGFDGSAQPSEDVLELPRSDLDEGALRKIAIETNRAPLLLAFAFAVMKYTMPEQPVSSRLSLAQAVVSSVSLRKAASIGMVNENTAEEEGWGRGQPRIMIMWREVAVMRRAPRQEEDVGGDEEQILQNNHETFWGIDLQSLRQSNNGPLILAPRDSGKVNGLPIYTPESARNYLLGSMTIVESDLKTENSVKAENELKAKTIIPKKKPSAKERAAGKEEAAAHLLQGLDLLFASWAHLSKDELNRRAGSWYNDIRPEIAQGQAGWGQRGQVKLADILKLRKSAEG